MKNIGKWVLLIGMAIAAYAFFFFDVTNNGYVNLGLMADRQNMLIAGAGFAIVGAIFITRGKGEWNEEKEKE